MTNKELLVELTSKMEEMLDEKLKPMEERFDRKLDALEERFDRKLDALENRFDKKLDDKLKPLKDLAEDTAMRVKRIELEIDLRVIPRLDTIEEAYGETYKRYRDAIDDFESFKTLRNQYPLMQDTIGEHSAMLKEHEKKLQELAKA